MVLRPDEPILYAFERPQTPAPDLLREMRFVTLLKMYFLLWVALPLLVAIAFPSVKDYMAIAAAALGASFLWLCWETRKVGRLPNPAAFLRVYGLAFGTSKRFAELFEVLHGAVDAPPSRCVRVG